MILIFLFLLGLCIGSFLGVVVDRLFKNESIISGRSYCDSCKKKLKWLDLIPVLSFIWLRGRCRYCNTSLSYSYPIIELLTGVLFALTYGIMNYELGIMDSIRLAYYLFIVSSLIVVFFTDLKYGIILDKIIFPSILITSTWLIINHLPAMQAQALQAGQSSIFNHILSGLGAFLLFLSLFVATKGKGMGFGDVKLSFLIGLILGFPGIVVSLYLAFVLGALISLILIFLKRKKFAKDTIPFGPFLVLGTLIALLWGNFIYSYFFKFFGF